MLKKFHFYRFEFKYLVSEKYKDFIREDLLPFMKWDNYAQLDKNKRYWVNSLYFDSQNLKSYHDKISGLNNRFKLRLRTYGLKKGNDIFFEIKRKRNAVVIKDRGIFSPSIYKHFIKEGKINMLNSKGIKKKNTLKDFLFLKDKYLMKPKLKIIYQREPFEGINYKNLRITFDSQVQANLAKSFVFDSYLKEVVKSYFILEVKFRGLLPYWFHDLIQKYQLERRAFSKYCHSLETVL